MGTAGPAANAAVGGAPTTQLDAESEFTFLEIELGVPGLLILTGLFAAFIGIGIRLRRVGDPTMQRLLGAIHGGAGRIRRQLDRWRRYGHLARCAVPLVGRRDARLLVSRDA